MLAFLIFFLVFSSILGVGLILSLWLLFSTFPLLYAYSFWIYLFGASGVIAFMLGIILCNVIPSNLVKLMRLDYEAFIFFDLSMHDIPSMIYTYGAIGLGVMTTVVTTLLIMWGISSVGGVSFNNWVSLIICIVWIIGINLYGLYKGFHTEITHYTVSLEGEHSWHGKKIILVSDSHYGNIWNHQHAKKAVEQVNTLGGDIVLFAGDFFDGPTIDWTEVTNEWKGIQAPHGVVFANGNHEEYRNTNEMLTALESAGIQILNNKKINIDGIIFAGVTYHSTETSEQLQESLDLLDFDPSQPTILIKHKPTLHHIIKKYPIDLVVSGHTHHGQMFPFSLITRLLYGRYSYGRVDDEKLTAITSSGLGSWGPPQRIGTSSEIVVIQIE